MTVTGIIYRTADISEPPGEKTGFCRTCGLEGDGAAFDDWVRDSFTDQDQLFDGTIVCRACLFCFDEKSTVLQEKLGRDKPQRMRNYSHLVAGGEWFALSKGEKTKIYELLLREPEAAVIAETGQKHLIFKARPGWWHFEGFNMRPFPERLKELYEAGRALYDLGITKAEIETGNYSQRTFLQNGIDRVTELDEPLKPHRGSIELRLAIYLMQKEKEDE
jgi:hypothetical protein